MLSSTRLRLPGLVPALPTACPHLRPRFYATEAPTPQPDPYHWPAHPHPTPYDILGIAKNEPYRKKRYAELVKLYHPDCSHHHPACQTHAHCCPAAPIRLDRFRLIVAAHNILSDPAKRSLYDRTGLGWGAYSHVSTGRNSPAADKWWQQREGHDTRAYGSGTYRDPSQNATWEDWERWRRAQDPTVGKQQEVYTKNTTFVGIVIVLAALGGVLEVGYAKGKGEEAQVFHEKQTVDLSEDIRRRRKEARELVEEVERGGAGAGGMGGREGRMEGLDGREERVRRFLITRDPRGELRGTVEGMAMLREGKKGVVGREEVGRVPSPEEEEELQRLAAPMPDGMSGPAHSARVEEVD